MLIEDAIAMLQLHEVPGKAAKMRAHYKIERVYWGLTTPLLDDHARQWRQDLSLADRLQLAAELWASNAHEGRICAAKLLTQARIRPDDNAAWQLLQTWLVEVDCAAICDHLCLAGHRRLSAISSALRVTCRSFTALTAHPTMNRENRSKTAAR